MNIRLENVGIIRSADVALDGLSVIAGHNSVGKSFIGKTAFAVIRARLDVDNKLLFKEIEPDTSNEFMKNRMDFYIKSIFKNELSNKISDLKAKVTICSEGEMFIEFIGLHNKTKTVNFYQGIPFIDVTLVESPVILQYASFIRNSLAFDSYEPDSRHRSKLAFHTFDLLRKLTDTSSDLTNESTQLIQTLISGRVNYDAIRDDFSFQDAQQQNFHILNVASGIKSFGLIQLLLSADYINEKSMLILDEPEVHLHPEWQLEYAKLLVNMTKLGIPILLTSHSPYFIEAIKVYSDKAGIADRTHFYLGEMRDGMAEFEDVSQNLDRIFSKLANPMIRLSVE